MGEQSQANEQSVELNGQNSSLSEFLDSIGKDTSIKELVGDVRKEVADKLSNEN
jgi:hypothetical protein